MFFMKLRKRAKWIFVLLAAAFGIGFIGFGIGGTGGGGVADVIGDIFGRSGSALPSVSEAEGRLADNPNDPEARQQYADALFSEQRFDEAKTAYTSYLELAPQDTSALRQLALLYQQDASTALNRATTLQQDSLQADPATATLFDPNSTEFTQTLAQNDLEAAIAQALQGRALVAFDEAAAAAVPWVEALERIAEIEPTSPTIQLQLGQAAEVANDNDRAVAAYLRALELDPASASAIQVRDQIFRLGGDVPDELNTLVEENVANPALDPNTPIFEQGGEGDPAVGPDGSIEEQQPIGDVGETGPAPAQGGSIGERIPITPSSEEEPSESILESDPAPGEAPTEAPADTPAESPAEPTEEPPADGG